MPWTASIDILTLNATAQMSFQESFLSFSAPFGQKGFGGELHVVFADSSELIGLTSSLQSAGLTVFSWALAMVWPSSIGCLSQRVEPPLQALMQSTFMAMVRQVSCALVAIELQAKTSRVMLLGCKRCRAH